MPVIGTPFAGPPDFNPKGVSPKITKIYDVPVPEKTRSIRVDDAQKPTVQWTMVDDAGFARDLSFYSASATSQAPAVVKLRMTDIAGDPFAAVRYFEFPGAFLDPTNGVVTANIDLATGPGPGIYNAVFGIYDPDGNLSFTNRFLLALEQSLFSAVPGGPPTLAEIRLHIRDSSSIESHLFDEVQFDDAEIAIQIAHCVHYWNEALPPLSTRYTTQTFPYRFYWIEGTIALLYRTAAAWYRRNRLPYQAGGVTVDDLNRAQEYETIGKDRWDAYMAWVKSTKISINIEGGFATFGSPYGQGYGYGRGLDY